MAFCPTCGAQVQGTFCPNCGTNVAAAQGAGTAGATGTGAAGTGTGATGAAYVPPGPPPAPAAAAMNENVAGALCYLAGLITGIIFLVIAPYNQNKFVRFHAFQSIFGHIAFIIFWIVYAIVGGILTFVTHGFGFFLYPLFGLLALILWLYLMYSAYNGRKVKLPIIGDLAERQA